MAGVTSLELLVGEAQEVFKKSTNTTDWNNRSKKISDTQMNRRTGVVEHLNYHDPQVRTYPH